MLKRMTTFALGAGTAALLASAASAGDNAVTFQFNQPDVDESAQLAVDGIDGTLSPGDVSITNAGQVCNLAWFDDNVNETHGVCDATGTGTATVNITGPANTHAVVTIKYEESWDTQVELTPISIQTHISESDDTVDLGSGLLLAVAAQADLSNLHINHENEASFGLGGAIQIPANFDWSDDIEEELEIEIALAESDD